MEPIFTETASETVTAKLAAQLAAATAALPPAHCLNPVEDEPTESKEAAFVRLQNWAFTKGFALVTESSKMKNGQVIRVYLSVYTTKRRLETAANLKKKTENEFRRRPRRMAASSLYMLAINQNLDNG